VPPRCIGEAHSSVPLLWHWSPQAFCPRPSPNPRAGRHGLTRRARKPPPQRWVAFQLLTALAQAHGRGVCHGDVKCENLLLTSWGWLYLADWGPYKPTYLPADNPVRAQGGGRRGAGGLGLGTGAVAGGRAGGSAGWSESRQSGRVGPGSRAAGAAAHS
jgi:serine/threonine protein kinase